MLPPTRVALVLCVALSACVGTEPASLPPSPSVLTLDEFLTRSREVSCRRALYCTAPRELSAWWDAAPELSCEDVVYGRQALSDEAHAYDAELRARWLEGTLVFDPARAAACLDALARTCTVDHLLACDGVVVGAVPIGAACRSRAECVAGAFCAWGSRSYFCGGTCAPLPPEGGRCAEGCDYCELEVCGYFAPVAVRGLHEPCEAEHTSTGAIRPAQCSGELVCRPQDCGFAREFADCPPTCELIPREGQTCDPTSSLGCGPGLACVDARCVPMIVRTAAGASCDDHRVFCDRFHRLLCDDGQCVEIGGGPGARCTGEWTVIDCDAGLHCDPGTSTCVVPHPDGERCFANAECESENCWQQRCDPQPGCPD